MADPSEARWDWSAAIILAMLALICYSQTLNYAFVQDDHRIIEEKPALYESPHAVATLMRIPTRVIFSDRDIGVSYYRPLIWVSFWLNYKMSGLDPKSYHALNILLHALNGLLLCYVVLLLSRRMDLAFWTAALFMVHPIHVGAVAWISGRNDCLALTAMLCAYLAFVKGRLCQTGWRFAWLVLSSGLYYAALLCKEMSIALPLTFLATDLLLFRREARSGSKTALVLPYLGWLVAAVLYMKLRTLFLGVTLPAVLFHRIQTSPPLLHIPAIYAYYVKSMIWPVAFQVAPVWHIPTSAADPLTWLYWLLLLGIFAAFALSRGPLVRMGIFVFLATILPVMYTPYGGLGDVFEWWAYTPSVGFVLLVAGGLVWLNRWSRWQTGIGSFVGSALLLACIALCWGRNPVYRDEVSYSSLAIRQHPEIPYYYINLGAFYDHRGDKAKAKSFYEQALKVDPHKRLANRNLGLLAANAGEYPQAIEYFKRELAVTPDDLISQVSIGHARLLMNQTPEALAAFDRAMAMDAGAAGDMLNGIAVALPPVQRAAAIGILETVLRHNPDHYAACVNLGASYESDGRYADACRMWQHALASFPQAPQLEEVKAHLAADQQALREPARKPAPAQQGPVGPGLPAGR